MANAHENTIARIKELLNIEKLVGDTDSMTSSQRTNHMLRMLVLGMCFVSFLATAQGLYQNVYVGSYVRAFLVSLALQGVIFVFSINACRYEKAPKGSWLLRAVFIFALAGSVTFDFTFICNLAYDQNNAGIRGNDVLLSEQYDKALTSAEEYLDDSKQDAVSNLVATLKEANSIVGAGSSQTMPSLNASDYASDSAEVYQSAVQLNDLLNAGGSREDFEALAELLGTQVEMLKSDAEAYGQNADRADANAREELARNGYETEDYRTFVEERKNAQDRQTQCLNDAERLSGLRIIALQAAGSTSIATASSISDLVVRLQSPDFDSQKVSDEIAELANRVIGATGIEGVDQSANGQNLMGLEVIQSLNRLSSRFRDLGQLEKGLNAAREYRASMRGVDGLLLETGDDGEKFKQAWADKWSTALGMLRGSLQAVPAYGEGADAESAGADVLDELVRDIDTLEHDRLGNLNNVEQALQYLVSFRFNTLAIISVVVALFLDLGACFIGAFANTRERMSE